MHTMLKNVELLTHLQYTVLTVAPWWFHCKPKHVAAASFILKMF